METLRQTNHSIVTTEGAGNCLAGGTKAYIPLRGRTTGVGALRWVAPPMRRFCVTYTKMLVSKNAKTPDAKPKIYPNAKPKHKSVEYRLHWVSNAKCSHWLCTFYVFCVDFICVWWPMRTQFPVEYGLEILSVM